MANGIGKTEVTSTVKELWAQKLTSLWSKDRVEQLEARQALTKRRKDKVERILLW